MARQVEQTATMDGYKTWIAHQDTSKLRSRPLRLVHQAKFRRQIEILLGLACIAHAFIRTAETHAQRSQELRCTVVHQSAPQRLKIPGKSGCGIRFEMGDVVRSH